jgi:hypothetical protein
VPTAVTIKIKNKKIETAVIEIGSCSRSNICVVGGGSGCDSDSDEQGAVVAAAQLDEAAEDDKEETAASAVVAAAVVVVVVWPTLASSHVGSSLSPGKRGSSAAYTAFSRV